MEQNPLFSVLIANYNNGPYLMEAIESVRQQTYTNWEIILVDDGSTDNSKELYKQLEKDTRIHIFYNEKNMGCGYTKRRCAELANGELCGFLDPDDALEKTALETMVSAHLERPNHSLIYSQFFYTDNNLNILEISQHQRDIPDNTSFLHLHRSGAISHFATFKKHYYDQTEGICPSQMRAVDINLYLLLEEIGKTAFIPKPLYYYRTETGKNISLDSNADKALFWDLIARINACNRRKLNLEKTILPMYFNILNEHECIGMDSTRNTHTYKIGRILLSPIKAIRSSIIKYTNKS